MVNHLTGAVSWAGPSHTELSDAPSVARPAQGGGLCPMGHELWLCLQFKHLQALLICEVALSVVRVSVMLVPAGLG